VATLSSLADRVRLELGDVGKSFVTQFTADGTTNRFRLHYSPLDGESLVVTKNNVDISNACSVEESTGVLVVDVLPADGDDFAVSGTYFRYFTGTEINQIVLDALAQHTSKHTDSLGRTITAENLPGIEEYPVAIYATTLALYTLATDASFDIDIQAPDGVSIPRSERYRQLMEMIQTRQEQYKDLCVHLGIGMYSIDVFTLRRISKMTNRYVPIYKPQEVDDRSFPQRAHVTLPTYGDVHVKFPTENGDLTAYQNRDYAGTVTFVGNYAGKAFKAQLVTQRGSLQTVMPFTLAVVSNKKSWVVTGVSRTLGSTTLTLTTSATHDFIVGDNVFISDVASGVNGLYTVATKSTTSFTVTGTVTTTLSLTGLKGLAEHSTSQTYTANLSLTEDQTLGLSQRTWWQIESVDDLSLDKNVIIEGNFFTVRISEAIL
jgi:hypothetical protein